MVGLDKLCERHENDENVLFFLLKPRNLKAELRGFKFEPTTRKLKANKQNPLSPQATAMLQRFALVEKGKNFCFFSPELWSH